MNANGYRQLYDYHFTFNRRIWDKCIIGLSDEQFDRALAYSIGSIHAQTVHMMSIEERWFSGLRGVTVPDFLKPEDFPDRAAVRLHWDKVESQIQNYLEALTDEKLFSPFNDLAVWQILLHVANHGTDHRAQVLAMLSSMGVQTFPQDLIFYLWGIDPSEH